MNADSTSGGADNVTIKQLQELVDSWAALRSEIDDIKDILEEKNKVKMGMEGKLVSIMNELDMQKFSGLVGRVELRKVDYVTLPATEEAQMQFFEYLKETDQFDQLASVHHQKLQSWYKSLIEEKGLVPVPGLDPMKTRYEIRKGR